MSHFTNGTSAPVCVLFLWSLQFATSLNPQGSQCLLNIPLAVLVDGVIEYVSDYVPSLSFLIALMFLLLRLVGFFVVILTLTIELCALFSSLDSEESELGLYISNMAISHPSTFRCLNYSDTASKPCFLKKSWGLRIFDWPTKINASP
jgi:hypothetical protein